jgi:hypothetical protein
MAAPAEGLGGEEENGFDFEALEEAGEDGWEPAEHEGPPVEVLEGKDPASDGDGEEGGEAMRTGDEGPADLALGVVSGFFEWGHVLSSVTRLARGARALKPAVSFVLLPGSHSYAGAPRQKTRFAKLTVPLVALDGGDEESEVVATVLCGVAPYEEGNKIVLAASDSSMPLLFSARGGWPLLEAVVPAFPVVIAEEIRAVYAMGEDTPPV